jgi:hypothetical protein
VGRFEGAAWCTRRSEVRADGASGVDFEVTAFEPPTRFAFNVTPGPVKRVVSSGSGPWGRAWR